MISINGASGEGGGQIVRTSLALSLISGQPFEIHNIRANRNPGGLRAQHLAAVKLAGQVSTASIVGAELHSQKFQFTPQEVRPGRYQAEIRTAGAASLVLQTVAIPLALQPKKSTIDLVGGTHVPFSPSYEFLLNTWQTILAKIGFQFKIELQTAGYYPRGGGEIHCRILPARDMIGLNLRDRGKLLKVRGYAGVSNLDRDIARRMKHEILRGCQLHTREVKIKTIEYASPGTGAWCCVIAVFENTIQTFTALGKKGKRAEIVAAEAVVAFSTFMDSPGAVDHFTADQLLLPLALAHGRSTYTTTRISNHLLTNAQVIQQFIPCEIMIDGNLNQPGSVTVHPADGFLSTDRKVP